MTHIRPSAAKKHRVFKARAKAALKVWERSERALKAAERKEERLAIAYSTAVDKLQDFEFYNQDFDRLT